MDRKIVDGKLEMTVRVAPEVRQAVEDTLVELMKYFRELATTARDDSFYQKTQKETRFYEGKNSAFKTCEDIVASIKVL